jgi:hypothetical protein
VTHTLNNIWTLANKAGSLEDLKLNLNDSNKPKIVLPNGSTIPIPVNTSPKNILHQNKNAIRTIKKRKQNNWAGLSDKDKQAINAELKIRGDNPDNESAQGILLQDITQVVKNYTINHIINPPRTQIERVACNQKATQLMNAIMPKVKQKRASSLATKTRNQAKPDHSRPNKITKPPPTAQASDSPSPSQSNQ